MTISWSWGDKGGDGVAVSWEGATATARDLDVIFVLLLAEPVGVVGGTD